MGSIEEQLVLISKEVRAQSRELSALGFENMKVVGIREDVETGVVLVDVSVSCAGHLLRLAIPMEAVSRLSSYLDLRNAQTASPALYRLSFLLQAQALDHAIASWLDAASLKGAVQRIETLELEGERVQRRLDFYGKSGEVLVWTRLRYADEAVGVRLHDACVLVEVYLPEEEVPLRVERVLLRSEINDGEVDVANVLTALLSSLRVRGTVKSFTQRIERLFARSA